MPCRAYITGMASDHRVTAKEFAELRKAAALTIRATADCLGVTEPTVWSWEHGKRPIPLLKADSIRRIMQGQSQEER